MDPWPQELPHAMDAAKKKKKKIGDFLNVKYFIKASSFGYLGMRVAVTEGCL